MDTLDLIIDILTINNLPNQTGNPFSESQGDKIIMTEKCLVKI